MRSMAAEMSHLPKFEGDGGELLEMLHAAALRLNRQPDALLLAQDLVDACREGTRADACFVYLYEEPDGDLVLRASSNAHPGEVGRLRMRLGEGITGWVAEQRRAVAIAAAAMQDPRFKFYSNLEEDSYQAMLSAPILHGSRVLGVINLQHREAHAHSPAEIKAVSTLGLIAGEALAGLRRQAWAVAAGQRWQRLEVLRARLAAHAEGGVSNPMAMPMLLEAAARSAGAERAVCAWQAGRESLRAAWPAAEGEEAQLSSEAAGLAPGLHRRERRAWLVIAPEAGLQGWLMLEFAAPLEMESADWQGFTLAASLLADSLRLEFWRRLAARQEEALEARKLIERAKGVLQQQLQISEEEAYRRLQAESRRQRRPMAATAQAVLAGSGMKSSTS